MLGAGEITPLLRQWGHGDRSSLDRLMVVFMPHLRLIAHRHFAKRNGHLLQTTALVNELYLRLARNSPQVQDREHMVALASRIMRQVLIDHAREQLRQKRGDGARRVSLEAATTVLSDCQTEQVTAIDGALDLLEAEDERKCRVFEMRFFGGFTVPEIAGALDVSENTVIRDWAFSCAWLRSRLSAGRR